MAARRIAVSSIDWLALSERVPAHQRAQFAAFKTKSDSYLNRVLALPEKAPEINWNVYKQQVPVAGMVEDFQKKYAALQIPYPADNVQPQIDAQEKIVQADIQKFKNESTARISEYKQKLAHLAALLPYDQMTMEDYRDAFPEDALDPINKPTFWPHEPEDQIDYEDKDPQPSGH